MMSIRLVFAACLVASVITACGTGDGGTAGNTELNVVVPNNGSQSPDPLGDPQPPFIDIQTVEYTIDCQGNADQFLDNTASFPDEVTLNGNLEVQDGRTNAAAIYGDPLIDGQAEIWQGFMDLPPGPCTVELRARDGDGEVICTAREPFTVAADSVVKVNIVLICDISFQAPVGMLDLDGTFSFNVGNFCPDLFVLNCMDEFPVEQVIAPPPIPPVAATTCEVRFRDGDSTCGDNCDPQTCVPDGLAGLTCTAGPDPGVSTTVTCVDGQIDCDFNPLTTETECVFTGDTLGALGVAPPNVPGAGAFALACIPPALGGTPGVSATCTAVTTDGDLDCNKTKTVSITCPGLTPCQDYDDQEGTGSGTQGGADATCQAAAGTLCVSAVCDDSLAVANSCLGDICCVNTNAPDGTDCSVENGNLPAECVGGVCNPLNCTNDGDCDDLNECTLDTCDVGTGICTNDGPANDGLACQPDASCGATDGTCGGGTCAGNDACSVAADCPNNPSAPADPQCTAPVCTGDVCGNFCEVDLAANSGGVCDAVGTGDGLCQANGECIFAPPACGLQAQTVSVGCVNNVTTAQSPFPYQLIVDSPAAILGGANFNVTLDGVGLFPEFFLNAAQGVVPGGVRVAELVAFKATVAVRSGATGPDVELGLDLGSLTPGPTQLCNFPPDQTCTVNGDCLGGVCNPPIILQELPVVDGIPGSAGGCDSLGGTQTPPDCDCSPCAALDTPPDTTKAGQCALNGFCQDGDLIVAFQDAPASYTADASGNVLWGWAENGIACPSGDPSACTAAFHVDGCLDIPPAGTANPVFGDTSGPTLIRVNASGLAVPIECAAGSDGGSCSTTTTTGCLTDADCPGAETCVGVGVDDDIICPTPDADLISCPIF